MGSLHLQSHPFDGLIMRSFSGRLLGMTWRRVLRYGLLGLAIILALAGLLYGSIWLYFHPRFEWQRGLVYGTRRGQTLTLDVVRPARPNGFGVALMVSGGWKSGTNSFHPWMATPLLRRGYTVFAVYHVSQPKATVMEIVEDMHRALRYVRYHAREYGVDPLHLGVTGGSAGGHLSLMLATRGGPGPASAPDPVDRETSVVQAAAIFYPVTDLLNLGRSTENPGDGGPPRSFVQAFGPQSTNLAVWKFVGREVSPIYYITSNLPPVLIYHGDADTLVPLDQSERFQAQAQALGRTVELVVHPGGKHGWLTMVWDIRRFADWFDRYLRAGT
jgi:acetyl esterase/lipase